MPLKKRKLEENNEMVRDNPTSNSRQQSGIAGIATEKIDWWSEQGNKKSRMILMLPKRAHNR